MSEGAEKLAPSSLLGLSLEQRMLVSRDSVRCEIHGPGRSARHLMSCWNSRSP